MVLCLTYPNGKDDEIVASLSYLDRDVAIWSVLEDQEVLDQMMIEKPLFFLTGPSSLHPFPHVAAVSVNSILALSVEDQNWITFWTPFQLSRSRDRETDDDRVFESESELSGQESISSIHHQCYHLPFRLPITAATQRKTSENNCFATLIRLCNLEIQSGIIIYLLYIN